MKPKTIWTLGVAGVLGCLVVVLIIDRPATESGKRAAKPDLGRNQAGVEPPPTVAPTEQPELPATPALTLAKSLRRTAKSAHSNGLAASKTNLAARKGAPPTGNSAPEKSAPLDPAAREQLGRMALNYVGADPAADEIWVWLINDPELSANVREDLIEDLNENGFSDGDGSVATVDDLPVIESRLLLIEEHMPFAMDEANAAAFAEAYKDLANMWWRLNGW